MRRFWTDPRDGEERLRRELAESRYAEEYLRVNEERLRFMLDLDRRAPALSEKEIFDLALDEAVKLTDSEIGYFHLVSDDQQSIELVTWNRKALESCTASPDTHHPMDAAGVWADAARLKRPVVHDDYQDLADRKGCPEGHMHLVRHLSVPAMDGERVRAILGVLALDLNATKGIITTTSDFAPGVEEEFEDVMPYRLETKNGQQFVEWIRGLV